MICHILGYSVSNYNNSFQADGQVLTLYSEMGQYSQVADNVLCTVNLDSEFQAPLIKEAIFSDGNLHNLSDHVTDGNLSNILNEFVSVQIPTPNIIESRDIPDDDDDQQMQQVGETLDQNSRCTNGCCKSYQKVLNKIDYHQKKWCKEFGLLHQESNANRQLLLRVLNILSPDDEPTDENLPEFTNYECCQATDKKC